MEDDVRVDAGRELWRLQLGLEPRDWKPMPSVGLGVAEIRVHRRIAMRVIYVARFADAIYVLHVFQKKSRKTSRRDLEIARRRYHMLASIHQ